MGAFTLLGYEAYRCRVDAISMLTYSLRRILAALIGAGLALLGAAQAMPSVASAVPAASSSSVASQIASLREVNYYPASEGWTRMWTNFDPSAIEADFARIHALGANTVRIIVFPTVFGYPSVSATYAARFSQVLQMAAANQLRVHLTLFDWWDNYSDTAGSEAWVRSLLSPYQGDSRIAVVELKNEMDPSNSAAMTWARALLPYLATVLPGVPRTVSTASVQPSVFAQLTKQLAATPPDFWDYHYYGDPGQAYSTLAKVKSIAGTTPLFLGETGATTLASSFESGAAADEAQAVYLETIFDAARALGLPVPAPWTLNDFGSSAVPPSTVGSKPETYDYGLYDTAGDPKPAAYVVASQFSGMSTSDIDGGFEKEDLPKDATVAGAWRVYLPQSATFAIDRTVARSGQASAEISNSRGDSSGAPSFYVIPPQPVNAGDNWVADAWVRGQQVTGNVRIAFSWFDASGKYLGQAESQSLPRGTTPWTELSVAAVAPAGATRVELHLKSSHDTGAAWFDDVSVAPTSGSATIGADQGSSTQGTLSAGAGAQQVSTKRTGVVVAKMTTRTVGHGTARVQVALRVRNSRRLGELTAVLALPRGANLVHAQRRPVGRKGHSMVWRWRSAPRHDRFALRATLAGVASPSQIRLRSIRFRRLAR